MLLSVISIANLAQYFKSLDKLQQIDYTTLEAVRSCTGERNKEMELKDIEREQSFAEDSAGDDPQGWKQNKLLAELALQLVKMNEQLARIATAVEVLERR